jgi:transcription elongation factor GreA
MSVRHIKALATEEVGLEEKPGMSQEIEIVLTPSGRQKLEHKLDHLRNVQRREVAERIRDSRQFGDLAENAEYEDAKTEQALVESQISEIRRVLQLAQVLEADDIPTDYVGIGSIVRLTNEDTDDDWELTLVSSVEADPDNDLISDESPVGEALMGKRVGDSVAIQVPNGTLHYHIESIRKS